MNQQAIFLPVITLFVLTMCVWLYLFAKRVPFINKNFENSQEITPLELQRRSPPASTGLRQKTRLQSGGYTVGHS